MIQREFGKRSGFHVARGGIGTMRLPEDHDEAVALLRHAIDAGMNYIDTSRGYGESEIKIGKALKDGYRKKVILSTKWCPWVMKVEETDDTSAACMRKRIEESMGRLDVDYLDFYQVWNIDSREHYDQAVAPGGMVDGIRQAMADGLVGHTGFTTHDSVPNLLTYIEEADWCETILFTYNVLNQTYAPAIQAAHEKGIGTVIMNPVGGGMLNSPSKLFDDLVEMSGAISSADMGIRYIMSNSAVDNIIAGISREKDVDDTVRSVEADGFSDQIKQKIESVVSAVALDRQEFCTGCRYCAPCPEGIDIPAVMNIIADYRMWGFEESAKDAYQAMQTPGAEACVKCGSCESKCTQHLGIMEEMGYALNTFGPKRKTEPPV